MNSRRGHQPKDELTAAMALREGGGLRAVEDAHSQESRSQESQSRRAQRAAHQRSAVGGGAVRQETGAVSVTGRSAAARKAMREEFTDPARQYFRPWRERGASFEESAPNGGSPWVPADAANLAYLGESSALRDSVAAVAAAAGLAFRAGAADSTSVAQTVSLGWLTEGNSLVPLKTVGTGRKLPIVIVGEDSAANLWTVAARAGADHALPLPQSAEWFAEYLTRTGRNEDQGPLVGFVGGSGGAGASTLAVLLAGHCVNTQIRTVLIDADPAGSGLENLIHMPSHGLDWSQLASSSGSIDSERLADLLPDFKRLSLLGFGEALGLPALPASAGEVFTAARAGFEITLVDVPRQQPAIHQVIYAGGSIICVVAATLSGILAARKITATLPPGQAGAVVRGKYPEGLDGDLIAEILQVPVLGRVPSLRPLRAFAEQGDIRPLSGNRSVQRLCARILDSLAGSGLEAAA